MTQDEAIKAVHDTGRAMVEADYRWRDELCAIFGKDAAEVSFFGKPEGMGAEGSRLREFYDAKEAAAALWRKACDDVKAVNSDPVHTS